MNIYDGEERTFVRAVDEVRAAIRIRPFCMEIKRDARRLARSAGKSAARSDREVN